MGVFIEAMPWALAIPPWNMLHRAQDAYLNRGRRNIVGSVRTSLSALACTALLFTGIGGVAGASRAGDGAPMPRFRHPDAALAEMTFKRVKKLRFLAPADMPPYAWRAGGGALSGFSVAVARSLCVQARIRCSFSALPVDRLIDALGQGRGDVVLAGPRMTAGNFARADFTRPYLKAMGVFATRKGASVERPDARSLAGKRIGVVRGTVHAAWLEKNYPQVRIHPYKSFAEAAEALRTAKTDFLFGDWLQVGFWARGKVSLGCCRLLPGWFPAREFSFNSTAMAVKRGNRELRNILDKYLDELENSGQLRNLARRHLPVSGDR